MSESGSRTTRGLIDELVRALPFPDPRGVDAQGLLAYGGDLSPERLIAAYAQGVFPWYDEDPILWFSPDPRMVLVPGELHVGRSLAKRMRAAPYRITLDAAFRDVIRACRETPRPGQEGTWITRDMVDAYCNLHELGFAHSVEAWSLDESGEERLVGGLYGVAIGGLFAGEAMFSRPELGGTDASKVALVRCVDLLRNSGFQLFDAQFSNPHLEQFGLREIPANEYLDLLRIATDARATWPDGAPQLD